MRVIIITGTPGTGKTTISEKVARALRNSELIRINDLVKEKRLFSSYSKRGEMVVNMKKLGRELAKTILKSKSKFLIIEGHLLCDVRIKRATAIVVREHLRTLLRRLRKRNYSISKIRDNIVSEATDYCGIRSSLNYNDVFEIFNDKKAVKKIVDIALKKRVRTESIDLLDELNEIIKINAKLAI